MFREQLREISASITAIIDAAIPDWLQWLWTVPLTAWMFGFGGISLGYMAQKHGWPWAIFTMLGFVTMFFWARGTV